MNMPDLSALTTPDSLPASVAGKTVTVYGSSSAGISDIYKQAAHELGEAVARAGLILVSGGGSAGLMGAAIDGALSAGGTTVGVLPEFMIERGWAHGGLTHTVAVPDMHARKALMAAYAGVVVAMPGGIGTFEEIFEIITWRQLALWSGQALILNTAGYYSDLVAMLSKAQEQHFMQRPGATGCSLYRVVDTAEEAISIITSVLCR